ncbi:hypothetical protein WJX81_005277 [Elliptochloris bilobata]|uniref:Origin recognition complex subunit 1 n=1 Tax=Elliptochloris bilobata TaxID=381761 RepID=A0AAW1RQZ9_9CHLO
MRRLRHFEADGETFRVGDAAFVVTEDGGEYESDEENEPCEICGEVEKPHAPKQALARRGRCADRSRARGCGEQDGREQEGGEGVLVPMLECGGCLRGFHLDCLNPPLDDVPKGDWLCEACAAGNPPPRRARALTAVEKLLAGRLGLARVEGFWTRGDGPPMVDLRWFLRPEDLHTGRLRHHGAREVFLGRGTAEAPAECLLRPVPVVSRRAFAEAPPANNDVLVCDYLYDEIAQVFQRRLEDEEEEQAADGLHLDDYEADSGSDALSDDDEAFKLVAATSLKPKSHTMPLSAFGFRVHKRVRKQGGREWTEKRGAGQLGALGAAEVPAAALGGDPGPGGLLAAAAAALAPAAVPRSMPCRGAERAALAAFLEEAVAAGEDCLGQCLYVSGVPGTGKTATALEVVRDLRRRATAGQLPAFRFVELNALRLPSPQHAYSALLEALTGARAGPKAALAALEALFGGAGAGGARGGGGRVTVLLVDEMDLLVTRQQSVLYNIFEWSTRPGARLAVIGIANTLDLPERLLPRIASRLGGRRLVFQPYSREQLKEIVLTRLADARVSAAFNPRAIEYAARKVAAVSGDVRRVLELCRKGAEVAAEEAAATAAASPPAAGAAAAPAAGNAPLGARSSGCVEMRHVDAAVQEMFSAAHMQLLGRACRLDKLLLVALMLETRFSGRAEAYLEDVAARLASLLAARLEPPVAPGDIVAAAARLGAQRLLLADAGGRRLRMRVALNVAPADVAHALRGAAAVAAVPWLAQLELL